jgi:hypothetical protein
MLQDGTHPLTSKAPASTGRLIRNRYVFEFFVRFPEGTSVMNGSRRVARQFKLHTLEDPTTVGTDTCRLLIHKNGHRLRAAAKITDTTCSNDDETRIEQLIADSKTWLATESGVHRSVQDWRHLGPGKR